MRKRDEIKINDVDIDTWLDSDIEELEQLPAEETTLKYEKKLVAFLDLLGIKSKIRNTKEGAESEVIALMAKIRDIVFKEAEENVGRADLNLLHLSDSFIFVCGPDMLPMLLNLLCIVQMRILIECKVMLRGALEYGSVIMDDDGKQIIGPAYIDAYERQEKQAIYPRIILSNAVLALIRDASPPYACTIMTYDREYALDCVQAYCDDEGDTNAVMSRLRREGVYDHLLNECKRFDGEGKLAVRAKYGWMINYLREKGVWPSERKYSDW